MINQVGKCGIEGCSRTGRWGQQRLEAQKLQNEYRYNNQFIVTEV